MQTSWQLLFLVDQLCAVTIAGTLTPIVKDPDRAFMPEQVQCHHLFLQQKLHLVSANDLGILVLLITTFYRHNAP